jgi:outer membrane protein OmpA-like peptidoglycan-associated protein
MAINLLEMLTEILGSEFAKQASEFLGESESTTKSALGLALPVLLGGLAKQGSTLDGAASLLKTLGGSNVDTGLLGNIAGLFSEKGKTDSLVTLGTSLLGNVFGDKVGSIASTIGSLTGLKSSSSSSLLGLAAPFLMSLLKKFVTEKNIDAAGLVSLLAEQTGFIKGKVNPQLAGAMGLGSLFDSLGGTRAASGSSPSRPSYAPPVVEEHSLVSKLMPWLVGLGALAAVFAMFRGCDKVDLGKATEPAASAVAPAAPKVTAPAVVVPAPAPTAVTAVLPAKVYFDVGSPNIEGPSAATLAQAVIAVKNQGLAVDITGYTDKTGDVAANEVLAKQRAEAVRDRLIAAGVPEGKIIMKPPFSITTTGTGSDAEARRVEITVAQ